MSACRHDRLLVRVPAAGAVARFSCRCSNFKAVFPRSCCIGFEARLGGAPLVGQAAGAVAYAGVCVCVRVCVCVCRQNGKNAFER